jgi:hypothetical protein
MQYLGSRLQLSAQLMPPRRNNLEVELIVSGLLGVVTLSSGERTTLVAVGDQAMAPVTAFQWVIARMR